MSEHVCCGCHDKELLQAQGMHVYSESLRLAALSNQMIGEKNDYYVTLEQLMEILREAGRPLAKERSA